MADCPLLHNTVAPHVFNTKLRVLPLLLSAGASRRMGFFTWAVYRGDTIMAFEVHLAGNAPWVQRIITELVIV